MPAAAGSFDFAQDMDIMIGSIGKGKKKTRQGRANTKHKALNSKQIQIFKIRIFQTKIAHEQILYVLDLVIRICLGFGYWIFVLFKIQVYSPIIWQITVLVLGLVSKSTKIICCQVPSVSWPSTIGTANEGPKTEALT